MYRGEEESKEEGLQGKINRGGNRLLVCDALLVGYPLLYYKQSRGRVVSVTEISGHYLVREMQDIWF